MIIKILILLIVILILYLTLTTLDSFQISDTEKKENEPVKEIIQEELKEKVKHQDIIQLEKIVLEQANKLEQISEERKSLQQDISDISNIVYAKDPTTMTSNVK